MYLTGTQYNLTERLHQLPVTTGELNLFFIEKSGYAVSPIQSGIWEKEEVKKRNIFDFGI